MSIARARVLLSAGVMLSAAAGAGTWAYLSASLTGCDSRSGTVAEGSSTSSLPRLTDEQRTVAGIVIGKTPVAELTTDAAKLGLSCEDVSLMEVMRKAHAQHNLPTDMAALSKLPNATPGVPAGMPSDHMKYLKDPALQQVRLSCDNAQLSLFGGGHVSGTGRLLLVADQKNEAIRSASLQRSDVDPHMAVADVRASLADLTARYGAPTWSQGTIPDANGTFSHLDHVVRRWDFAGVSVELSAVDFAARGVAVSEEVHVPYDRPKLASR